MKLFKAIEIPSDFRRQNEITAESEQDMLIYQNLQKCLDLSIPCTSTMLSVGTIDE